MARRAHKIGGGKGGKGGTSLAPFSTAGMTGLLMIIVSCLFLFSAFKPNALSGAKSTVTDTAAPFLNAIATPIQNIGVFLRDVTSLAQMQAENERLKEENVKLREWYQSALKLEAENQSLRELLNVKIDPQNAHITARILSDSNSTFAKSLLISAGAADGVQKGQAVIAGDGLIGRITDTGENTARVLLITDMNSRVPVIIENSRQHAIFAGRNEHDGILIHLPPDTKVTQGARVTTSGLGGIFPTGLPLGVIRNTENMIVVEPFADFNRLMHVRIISRSSMRDVQNKTINPEDESGLK